MGLALGVLACLIQRQRFFCSLPFTVTYSRMSPAPFTPSSRAFLWVWIAICGVGVLALVAFDVVVRVQMARRRAVVRFV